MPMYYHTDWKPQFGEPILPPSPPKRRRGPRRRIGSWERPSRAMLERELKKCTIKRIDLTTDEVRDVRTAESRASATRYGATGRARRIPRRK